MIYSISLPDHKYARPGKSVWKSREDAEYYRDLNPERGFVLWGIEANWECDTRPCLDGDWNELTIEAEMFEL